MIAISLLIVLMSACTSTEQTSFQMPTLAMLPSITVAVETLTATQPPADTVSPTFTSLQTITSSPTFTETPPCDIAAWWTTISPTVVRFFDTWDVAGVTARSSLSPILLELREIWQIFEGLDYPECASALRDEVIAGMADTADGFNEFLAQNDASILILQRAALRFQAIAEQLVQYAITADSRLSSKIDEWGSQPGALTLTWIFMPDDDRVTASAATSAARATSLIQGMTMTAAVIEAIETLTPATS